MGKSRVSLKKPVECNTEVNQSNTGDVEKVKQNRGTDISGGIIQLIVFVIILNMALAPLFMHVMSKR